MPVRQILQLIAALCFVVSGCTSGSTASSPDASSRAPANAADEGPMCGNFAVNKIAHSLTRNLCTMDYIWSLVGPEGAKTNLTTCAASYVVTGAAVAGSSALIGRRLLNGDGSFQRVIAGERNVLSKQTQETLQWIRNLENEVFLVGDGSHFPSTPYTHPEDARRGTIIRHQAMARIFEQQNLKYSQSQLGAYKSSTLDAISLDPKRRIRIHFGSGTSSPRVGYETFYLGVTPGPTETQVRLGRSLMKLAYLGAATMATGGVFFIVDQLAGATPTACSQISEKYYSADPNNYCKPRMAISPEVVEFLNLDSESQRQLLTTYPELCRVYDDIAGTVDRDMAQQFDVKSITERCERDYLAVDLEMANTAKAEIQLNAKEIRVTSNMDRIVAQYERNATGMKLTSIRWAPFVGGVKARTFKMPVDTETFNTPLFQRVQSRLGTYMIHLENKGLFDRTCVAAN